MKKKIQNNSSTKKPNRKKVLLVGLGVIATGLLSFFGYHYWSKNKNQNDSLPDNAPDFAAKKTSTIDTATASPKKTNPPKAKSQKAKTNPSATSATKANKPKAKTTDPINPDTIATFLHKSITGKNFQKVLISLIAIQNVAHYTQVGKFFAALQKGNKQTVLEACFAAFKTEAQKAAMRKEFLRIGLKFNGKKWSLSGIEQPALIITTKPTRVWKNPKTSVDVPMNMVLGNEITQRGKFSLFENAGQFFLVESVAVKAYKA
jgi:hypothetical protein